jgi:hypothetical protein
MKNAIDLQNSTLAGRVVRMAALLALTMVLGLSLTVIFRESATFLSIPTGSTPTERGNTHKTGPWHFGAPSARV